MIYGSTLAVYNSIGEVCNFDAFYCSIVLFSMCMTEHEKAFYFACFYINPGQKLLKFRNALSYK